MNWQAVIDELDRVGKEHEATVRDHYKHPSIKQSSAIIGAVLFALASAFRKGLDQ